MTGGPKLAAGVGDWPAGFCCGSSRAACPQLWGPDWLFLWALPEPVLVICSRNYPSPPTPIPNVQTLLGRYPTDTSPGCTEWKCQDEGISPGLHLALPAALQLTVLNQSCMFRPFPRVGVGGSVKASPRSGPMDVMHRLALIKAAALVCKSGGVGRGSPAPNMRQAALR